MTQQETLFQNRARLASAHAEFLKLTNERYHALCQRVGPKINKRGFVLDPGQLLPFQLEHYRDWCRQQLGGEQGATRCEYCCAVVNIHTMVVDHRTPLAQAGPLDMQNMCVTCKPCNDQKGAMRAQAFLALLNLVNDSQLFSPIDRTDCLGRLQMALRLALKLRAKNGAQNSSKQRVMPHVRGSGELL